MEIARHLEALGGLQQLALVRGGPLHQLAEIALRAVEVFLIRLHPRHEAWTICSISADCSAVSFSSCMYRWSSTSPMAGGAPGERSDVALLLELAGLEAGGQARGRSQGAADEREREELFAWK